MRKSPSEIRKCIYCLHEQIYSTDTSVSHFNSEHVVHAGLATNISEDINLTLIGLVCSSCNTYFGRKLDQQFLRSGYIGMLRFDAGQKPANKFHEFDAKSLKLTAYRPDEPTVHGIPVERIVHNAELPARFRDVVAIELDTGWQNLTENQIDCGDVPKISNTASVTFKMMCDPDDEPRIMDKLSRHYRLLDKEKKWDIGYVPVLGAGELTEIEFRSLAKIAFNYLAFICGDILRYPAVLFHSSLNEIRNFVRYGCIPVPLYKPVTEERGDVSLSDMTQPPDRRKHFVSIRQVKNGKGNSIICSVNLFDSIVWAVELSPNINIESHTLNHGHVWDLAAKTCKPMN